MEFAIQLQRCKLYYTKYPGLIFSINNLVFFTGREEIYLSKWFAFPRMAFILHKGKPRPTINSLEVYKQIIKSNI